jgi:hypothetical protein
MFIENLKQKYDEKQRALFEFIHIKNGDYEELIS